MDISIALGIALVLLMSMTVVITRQSAGERRLAAARTAARYTEAALLAVQNGGALARGAVLRPLPDPAPAGYAWVRIEVPGSGSGNSTIPGQVLVGMVPTRLLPPATGRGGAP